MSHLAKLRRRWQRMGQQVLLLRQLRHHRTIPATPATAPGTPGQDWKRRLLDQRPSCVLLRPPRVVKRHWWPTRTKRLIKRKAEQELSRDKPTDLMVSCEIDMIDVLGKDFKRWISKPKKAGVWLSQKTSEKSREVSWKSLILKR